MLRSTLLCAFLYCCSNASAVYIDHDNVAIPPPEGCTTIVVDGAASSDGPMATHTNDCKDCDWRLSRVPQRAYDEQNKHRAVIASRFSYPRYIGEDRGETLRPEYVDFSIYPWNATQLSGAVGHIPQPSKLTIHHHHKHEQETEHEVLSERAELAHHSFAYIDGNYGILNEHGVGIGESTCAGRMVSTPVFAIDAETGEHGEALFDVVELSKIAMERASTARQAIRVMGSLAEEYGYYGAEWEGAFAKGEAGEALTITDATEAWVFHITPDHTGKSAVWVAQRVPQGHVAVVANAFIIQDIDLNDSDNFLASANIYSSAEHAGLWSRKNRDKEPFNFSRIYGSRISFEIYCSRRMWRVFSLVAPEYSAKHLSPNMTVLELPFSVEAERTLSSADLMQIQRDHYEGTDFDMTKGLAAGPYGNPNRYDRGGNETDMSVLMQGTFERAISLFRTSYSFVTNSRGASGLPAEVANRVWVGMASPHSTVYTPLYPSSAALPRSHTTGSLYKLDRRSAWWAATAIGNYMERMWMYISRDVYAAQHRAEKILRSNTQHIEDYAVELYQNGSTADASNVLQRYSVDIAESQTLEWWAFLDHLMTKYHDGYELTDFHAETVSPFALFYPHKWLEAVGFWPNGYDADKKDWSYTTDWKLGSDKAAIDYEPGHSRHNDQGGKQSPAASHSNQATTADKSSSSKQDKETEQHKLDNSVIHVPHHHEARHAHAHEWHGRALEVLTAAGGSLVVGFLLGTRYGTRRAYRRLGEDFE